VDFVDDVDLESASGWTVNGILSQFPDVVNAAVGRTVNLDDVNIFPQVHGNTTVTLAAGRYRRTIGRKTVQGFGQDTGHSRFPDAPGACKEVRVRDSARFYGVLERL
jgi:hypothetical protein